MSSPLVTKSVASNIRIEEELYSIAYVENLLGVYINNYKKINLINLIK